MFKTYKRYYQFLLHYKTRFVVFALVVIVWGLMESAQPFFYKLLIDNIPSGDYSILLKILVGYMGLRLIILILDIVGVWLGDWSLIPAARDARQTVFKKIQDLDFAYHLSRSTGSLISSMKRGDAAFYSVHHVINIGLARTLIYFATMLYFFAQVGVDLSLILLGSFAVNGLLAASLIKKNIAARKEFNKSEDRVSAVIVDNLINFETVKLFAQERKELSRLKEEFVPWIQRLWNYANSFRLIDLVVGLTGNVGVFIVLFVGLRQTVSGVISAGDYIMLLSFVTTFYFRFFELIYRLRNLAKEYSDLETYFDVLDLEAQVKDPVDPNTTQSIDGEIKFDQVSFSYPEGKQDALNQIDLKIRQGQSVAFVGHSGAGKTSITKLLLRFYDPDEGRILLDGIDIRDFSKSQLRSFIGVVPQEPIMFNNTIAFNIAYGVEGATQDEIEAAAKMANLHDFIVTMPQGYSTNVGERGIKLSGGQKQRLAIARMILSNPDVIIFDEATSQLDSESEQKIQEAFWKASANKTTIIIAHRLSSITRADKIIVMEDGEIVEIGSHQDLLQRSEGIYQKFWQLQSGELLE